MACRQRIPCLLVALVLLAGTLAGCGNSRTPVPELGQPAPSSRVRVLELASAGVLLVVPRSWLAVSSSGPLLVTIASGSAAMAVWSYHRTAAPPVGPTAIARARSALLAAVRRRDPTLQPIRVAAIRLGGHPAVELDALEHIKGQLRRVRSVHVYGPGQELVFDAYAPPSVFHPVDRAVFSPVKRSLRFQWPGTT